MRRTGWRSERKDCADDVIGTIVRVDDTGRQACDLAAG
jgi:hypothetical protein